MIYTKIQTWSGLMVDLEDPQPGKIKLEDIFMSLRSMVRYNGHMKKHITVLEHCVMVAEHVPDDAVPYALLHDAHEAYIGDITTPVAQALDCRALPRLKRRFDHVIWEAFGLDRPSQKIINAVAKADAEAVAFEQKYCLAKPEVKWASNKAAWDGYEMRTTSSYELMWMSMLTRTCPRLP